MHSLREKLENLIAATENPVVIFDLDGTLFDVNYRSLEIVRRFLSQEEIQKSFPTECKKAAAISASTMAYGIEGTLNQAGIDRDSEHAAHFIAKAEAFWFKRFFTDELVLFDVPYAGAVDCVKHFHRKGLEVVYLSGRDVPNMSKGTVECLEKFGFPHRGHRVAMHLKPAYGMDDLQFKIDALESIKKLGNIVATFDNEPANVVMFAEKFPKAMNFHFDTLYTRPLDLNRPGISVIKGFHQLEF